MEFFKEANEPVITEGYDEPLTAQPVPLEELTKEQLIEVVKHMEWTIKQLEEGNKTTQIKVEEITNMYNNDLSEAKSFIEQLNKFYQDRMQALLAVIDSSKVLMNEFKFEKGKE